MGRLGLTAAAIAFGVVILLSFVSGVNGITSRVLERGNWVLYSYQGTGTSAAAKEAQKPIEGVAPLRINPFAPADSLSAWRENDIRIVAMHKTGDTSPDFPGFKTPAMGEYYLSPGLDKIARENPEENIGSRFGTTYLGVLPDSHTPSPDSLMAVRGSTSQEIAESQTQRQQPGGKDAYTDIYNTSPKGSNATSFDPITPMMLAFGATILLAPIVLFVAVATQLGSAQREQRYAALRLIGATRNQVNRVILFESFVATVAGIVLGSIIFFATRGWLQAFQFGGEHFWLEDLTVSWWQYGAFSLITIALSLFASWRAMRKVQTSPLGVARREKLNKRPRAWRVIPLAVGVSIFVWLSTEAGVSWVRNNPQSVAPFAAIMGGILLVTMGLMLAGSWLTSVLSRVAARFTARPTTLIAAKRIKEHSRHVFRSVGGVVLALFAGSFYLAAVSGVDVLSVDSIAKNGYTQLKEDAIYIAEQSGKGFSKDMDQMLARQPFVAAVATAYRKPFPSADMDPTTILSCADIQNFTTRTCSDGAADGYGAINFDAEPVKTPAPLATPTAEDQKVYLVKLTANDQIDKLRTALAAYTKDTDEFVTIRTGERARKPAINPVIKDLADIAYVGIAITLFVAIASLIVSTIGGLIERRRSLFTLRLSGMTLGQMKRMVLIESLIPLISVSLLAAGTGVWVASTFLKTFSSTVRVHLSPIYFIIIGSSLVAAVIGIWLILPAIKRITSLERNQTE